jgi:hypothetical protein
VAFDVSTDMCLVSAPREMTPPGLFESSH